MARAATDAALAATVKEDILETRYLQPLSMHGSILRPSSGGERRRLSSRRAFECRRTSFERTRRRQAAEDHQCPRVVEGCVTRQPTVQKFPDGHDGHLSLFRTRAQRRTRKVPRGVALVRAQEGNHGVRVSRSSSRRDLRSRRQRAASGLGGLAGWLGACASRCPLIPSAANFPRRAPARTHSALDHRPRCN